MARHVRVCKGDAVIAAWPTDQRGLAGLRSLLLDPARTPAEAVQAGLAWLDARPSFLAVEMSAGGDRIEIDLINPTRGELVILAAWESEPTEIALIAPPNSISRHEIDRPDLGAAALAPRPGASTDRPAAREPARRQLLLLVD